MLHSNPKAKEGRVHLIDEVRGFAIICMVIYHAMYDLVAIFEIDLPIFYLLQKIVPVFVFAFVFISGTASAYSKSNVIRGVRCFLLGAAMTLITWLFMPSQLIVFGILHMLGCCMTIYGLYQLLARRYFKDIPTPKLWWITIAVCISLFLLTYHLPDGYLGFGAFNITLPRALYSYTWLAPFGFPPNDFFSADYFSLIPWLFAFIAGTAFGKLLKHTNMPALFYRSNLKPLAFVGRNTLVIYILHQPVVYGVLTLIFTVFVK